MIEQILDGGGHGGVGPAEGQIIGLNLLCSGAIYKEDRMATRPSKYRKTDVVIGGAGFAGLALAIALRQALGEVSR